MRERKDALLTRLDSPCSGECHIEPSWIREEPNGLLLVRPNTGHDDNVLLSSLEGIHAADLNLLVEVLPEATLPEEDADHMSSLTLVGGDDANLRGLHSTLSRIIDAPMREME